MLGEYRRVSGDATPAIVVSTASPYKFCDSVLAALGEDASAPGFELLGRLEAVTGTSAPAPLASLAGKEPRFTACVAPEAMRRAVEDFVG